MKRIVWLLSTLLILSGCATAPRSAQVLEVCPKVPPLELDAPERDWLGQMRNFLSGSLPMRPDYNLPSINAAGSILRLKAD